MELIPDAIRIFVGDATAAQSFYCDTLGLPLQAGSAELGYLVFNLAGLRLIVESADPNEDEGRDLIGRIVGLSFRVGDIQDAYRELQSRGVFFTGHPEKQHWGGVLAHFRDSAGNVLSLVEHLTD
jgi:catechol 2,3-dioxygenase-like lactoylglutathione lyase family enzyme